MLRRHVVVLATVFVWSACSDAVPLATASIRPQTVKANWDLSYGTDGPPIAIDLGSMRSGTDEWAEQDVEIRGAQIEYVVDLNLTASEFTTDGSALVGVEPDNARLVRLRDNEAVSIRVSIPNELPAGVHTFDLVLPVWINAKDPGTGQPDDRVTISLSYTVQSALDQQAAQAFCEGAVPLTNGRTPSVPELDEISDLADAELDADDHQALAGAVSRLSQDLDAYRSGSGSGHNTGELNSIIGHICNIDMLSEDVIDD